MLGHDHGALSPSAGYGPVLSAGGADGDLLLLTCRIRRTCCPVLSRRAPDGSRLPSSTGTCTHRNPPWQRCGGCLLCLCPSSPAPPLLGRHPSWMCHTAPLH